MIKNVKDIDWDNWDPKEKSTIIFIIKDDQVLLINKKRGLGKGKINGPGGKIESGETDSECIIRETKEEVCIDVKNPILAGELFFQFTDGISIYAKVFHSKTFNGEPKETEEAYPFWCSINDIPYNRMWEDDITWLPYLFLNKYFKGYYIFDGDCMIDCMVKI